MPSPINVPGTVSNVCDGSTRQRIEKMTGIWMTYSA